jgi:hypothetical protein
MHSDEKVIVSVLFQAFDLGGTFVFAISGAVAGVRHKLDLFGVLVLSFETATFGGMARDVLIGLSLRLRFRTGVTWPFRSLPELSPSFSFIPK